MTDKECHCVNMYCSGAYPKFWCEKHGMVNVDPLVQQAILRLTKERNKYANELYDLMEKKK